MPKRKSFAVQSKAHFLPLREEKAEPEKEDEILSEFSPSEKQAINEHKSQFKKQLIAESEKLKKTLIIKFHNLNDTAIWIAKKVLPGFMRINKALEKLLSAKMHGNKEKYPAYIKKVKSEVTDCIGIFKKGEIEKIQLIIQQLAYPLHINEISLSKQLLSLIDTLDLNGMSQLIQYLSISKNAIAILFDYLSFLDSSLEESQGILEKNDPSQNLKAVLNALEDSDVYLNNIMLIIFDNCLYAAEDFKEEPAPTPSWTIRPPLTPLYTGSPPPMSVESKESLSSNFSLGN